MSKKDFVCSLYTLLCPRYVDRMIDDWNLFRLDRTSISIANGADYKKIKGISEARKSMQRGRAWLFDYSDRVLHLHNNNNNNNNNTDNWVVNCSTWVIWSHLQVKQWFIRSLRWKISSFQTQYDAVYKGPTMSQLCNKSRPVRRRHLKILRSILVLNVRS